MPEHSPGTPTLLEKRERRTSELLQQTLEEEKKVSIEVRLERRRQRIAALAEQQGLRQGLPGQAQSPVIDPFQQFPLTGHGEPPQGPNVLELVGVAGVSLATGLISGVTKPLEKVPFLGSHIIRPFVSPTVERANLASLQLMQREITEAGGDSSLLKIAGSGGKILGNLTGFMVPFTGILKGANLLAKATKLPALMADFTGFFAYGALTKEPSLLQHVFFRSSEGVETHRDSFLRDLGERLATGAAQAGELGGLTLAFRSIFGTVRALRSSRGSQEATRTQAGSGRAITAADAVGGGEAGSIIDASGGIITKQMNSVEEAAAHARIATSSEVIERSPIASQMAREGEQATEMMVEALRGTEKGAVIGVYAVEDPAIYLKKVAQELSRPAEVSLRNLLGKAEETIGDGLAHSAKRIAEIAAERSTSPLFRMYGRNTAVGTIFRGEIQGVSQAAKKGDDLLEILIQPSKKEGVVRVKDWNAYADQYGRTSAHEGFETLRKQGKEVLVIERARGGEQEVVALTQGAIRSAEAVTAEAASKVGAVVKRPDPRGLILTVDEPAAVRLAKRFDDMNFHVAEVKGGGNEGLVNILGWPKTITMPQRLIQQFTESGGFLEGQSVWHRGGTYVVKGVGAEGATLKGLHGGKDLKQIPLSELRAYPEVELPGEVVDGFTKELTSRFIAFFEKTVREVSAQAPGRVGMRDLIRKMKNPEKTHRDIDLQNTAVNHAEEVSKLAPESISPRGDIVEGFLSGDASILMNEPYPILGEFGAVFKKFLQTEGLSLSAAEEGVLRVGMARRLGESLYKKMPGKDREIFESVTKEALERLNKAIADNPLDALAALEGYTVAPMSQGRFQMTKFGTGHIFVAADEEVALAFLRNHTKVAGELLKGSEYIGLSLPGGHGLRQAGALADEILLNISENETQAARMIDLMTDGIGIPNVMFKSLRKWVRDMADKTFGAPLIRLFDNVTNGRVLMGNEAFPFHRTLDKAMKISRFKTLPVQENRQIGEFIRTIETQEQFLNTAERLAAARRFGLNEKQINLMETARRIERDLFVEQQRVHGFKFEDSYMYNYYKKVQPRAAAGGDWHDEIFKNAKAGTMQKFFGEHTRNQNLALVETHFGLVMKRYVNAVFFDKHLSAPIKELDALVQMPFRTLPKDVQDAVKKLQPTRKFEGSSPALPEAFRKPLEAVMEYSHGYPNVAETTAKNLIKGFWGKLGVDMSDQAIQEFFNIQMGLWYGAGIGGRVRNIIRNFIQDMWNDYPAVGGAAMEKGFRYVNKNWNKAYNEAVAAGAVPLKDRGVLGGQVAFDAALEEMPIKSLTGGLGSSIIAGVARSALKAGRFATKIGGATIRPFSASDIYNRVRSYHTNKFAVEPWLKKLNAKQIGEAEFRRKGLFGWGKSEQDTILAINSERGSEAALKYIGTQGSNFAQYIYGLRTQPLWMQGPVGRMFGTFGTWPIWQKDLLFSRWKNTDAAGRMLMASRYLAVTGVIGNLGYQWGVDLTNWIAPIVPWRWFPGSVAGELLVDTKTVVESPWAQKPEAIKRLAQEYGRIVFPGELLIKDIGQSFEALAETGDPRSALGGLLFGRPTERGPNLFLWSMRDSAVQFKLPAPEPGAALFIQNR